MFSCPNNCLLQSFSNLYILYNVFQRGFAPFQRLDSDVLSAQTVACPFGSSLPGHSSIISDIKQQRSETDFAHCKRAV